MVEVVQDLAAVLAQRLGDLLHLRHVRVHDPAAQRVQLDLRLRARLALVDRLQRLAHLARPRGLEALARQLALPGGLALGEVALVLEPYVLAPGEQRALLLGLPGLGHPHLVDLPGGDLDDVEPVGHALGVGQVLGDALGKRRGQVAGHDLDGERIAAVRLELRGEGRHRRGVAAQLADHDAGLVEVHEARDVAVAAPAGRLVDPDLSHAGEVGPRVRLADDPVEHRPHPRVALAHEPRYAPDRHGRHRHQQHLRLEQRGEVLRVRRRPRDLGRDGPSRAVQARQPAVDEGLVLPDVEVAPRALARVVDAVVAAAPRAGKGVPGRALDVDVQLRRHPGRLLYLDAHDGPLGAEPERPAYQRRHHLVLGSHAAPLYACSDDDDSTG